MTVVVVAVKYFVNKVSTHRYYIILLDSPNLKKKKQCKLKSTFGLKIPFKFTPMEKRKILFAKSQKCQAEV